MALACDRFVDVSLSIFLSQMFFPGAVVLLAQPSGRMQGGLNGCQNGQFVPTGLPANRSTCPEKHLKDSHIPNQLTLNPLRIAMPSRN